MDTQVIEWIVIGAILVIWNAFLYIRMRKDNAVNNNTSDKEE